MITQSERFPIFIAVSLVVFVTILRWVLRKRDTAPGWTAVLIVALIVVVGGMLFAKLGQNAGWPWWIYYTIPAAVTLLLSPLAFRMSRDELWPFLALAFLSSPLIHVFFSFFIGWHNYLPFIHVPSLWELLG